MSNQRWVEWIEPFGPNNEPVYLRVPESTAIAQVKHVYGEMSDEDALEEFMVVKWASFVEDDRG